MVALARVLLRDNVLLLVDEPTKGLAPKLVTEVADVLARVAATTPILLVEQNLPARAAHRGHASSSSTRARVVHRGDAAALLADADLTRELLGVSMRRRGGGMSTASSSLVTGLGLGALYFLAASRAQPHLRPDGRAQLRPRRLHDSPARMPAG